MGLPFLLRWRKEFSGRREFPFLEYSTEQKFLFRQQIFLERTVNPTVDQVERFECTLKALLVFRSLDNWIESQLQYTRSPNTIQNDSSTDIIVLEKRIRAHQARELLARKKLSALQDEIATMFSSLKATTEMLLNEKRYSVSIFEIKLVRH
jgi:hypothetical protein